MVCKYHWVKDTKDDRDGTLFLICAGRNFFAHLLLLYHNMNPKYNHNSISTFLLKHGSPGNTREYQASGKSQHNNYIEYRFHRKSCIRQRITYLFLELILRVTKIYASVCPFPIELINVAFWRVTEIRANQIP